MNTTPHTRTNRRARTRALTAAAFGAGLSFAAVPAHAEEWLDTLMDWNPYVGADFNITSVNYEDETINGIALIGDDFFDTTLYGLDLHGGFTPHENFGVEAGLFYNLPGEKSSTIGVVSVKNETSLWGLTLDGMGYYAPLNNNNKNFKLIGTGGVTLSFVENEGELGAPLNTTSKTDDTGLGFRLGGGMQFGMTENTNARVLVRHWWTGVDGVENAWLYSFGMNYEF